ncbi:trehalase isoform X2 [Oncorhynchus keta]|uniref:trehalase isoform X2 n=1 Tax=Oncorhynchus keta TaxID=8018 RepID=UPI00227D1A0B|nr:trehalase isoform X2 [Oncorhynchus keta]
MRVFQSCVCASLVLFFCPLYSCALPPPCDSEIYCYGDILRQVQTAKLFDDDKHFVDMKLKSAPDIILTAFHNLTHGDPNAVPPAVLRDFLHTYFDEPGKEFAPWSPPDWHDKPQFLAGIADAELRSWAEKLHHLWKSLGRKFSSDALAHPERYSQIFTPHPFVVPGGRFRELYYWDSYWVINGLLLSEMTDTARGMILNFIHLINRYGFIPNGARVYYERRSQPPFLSLMVESYYQTTNDTDFLRPESYSDDLELAEGLTEDAAERLWKELHSGAESGWDFSSRWFVDGLGNNNGSLKDTRTSLLVPTDLNALLCRNERTLAHFYRTLGNESEAARYDKAVSARQEAIEAVLWDEKRGVWLDYSLVTNTSHPAFYPTNLTPVWADCYSQPSMGQKALHYLQTSGGLAFPNGVPTSLVDSGQQWDYPNAWPPLQHILIQGLSSLPSQEARELGFDLAQRWIRTNWLAYVKYEAMFEKYDVNGDGKPGGGGEYEVQLGFGWTNGVALQLLSQYGDRLSSGSNGNSFTSCLSISVSVALLCSAQTLFL